MSQDDIRIDINETRETVQEQLQQHPNNQAHQLPMQEDVARVSGVSLRLPPFWPENPALWLAQVEAQFAIHRITSDSSKFFYVISQLEQRYAAEVQDVITNPPAQGKFMKLKTELERRITATRDERIRQLLTQAEMGDKKPSQFLRYLRSLVPSAETVPDQLLRTLWSGRLPTPIRTVIATQNDLAIDAVAELADKVFEVISPSNIASISSPQVITKPKLVCNSQSRTIPNEFTIQIEQLTRQVSALSARLDEFEHRHRDRSQLRRRSRSRPSTPKPESSNESQTCWYHRRFGADARCCTSPCKFSPNSSGDQ